MKKPRKHFAAAIFFTILLTVLLVLSVSEGAVYGSHVDWFSQHAALAETIRDACVSQKTLAPAFLPLGGGSNGFQFSYYGYFRPDILIGCLFPEVPMMPILIGYVLLGYLASVILFYRWLQEEDLENAIAFPVTVLFLTAACFFQTHRQIMFINYMPFLLAALLSVKKRKPVLLAGCLFLIHIHSFYFSIACLAVVGLYWMEQEGWKNRKAYAGYMGAAALSVGMAAMLLVPTAMVLLEHHRSSDNASAWELFGIPNGTEGLLYGAYGMGLTFLVLYLLLTGLAEKKYRRECAIWLVISFWGGAAWILNGLLYGRPKALIPFLPMVLLTCARLLQAMHRVEVRWRLWPLLMGIPIVIGMDLLAGRERARMVLLDILVLALVCLWQRIRTDDRRHKKEWAVSVCILLLMPCVLFVYTNRQEEFVGKEEAAAVESQETVQSAALENRLYRAEQLTEPLASCNRVALANQQKSSMYSSITNAAYADVIYNQLQTPIRINNRVALLTDENPFLLQFMGIRYLLTDADRIPGGYREVETYGSQVLAENPSVLPMAYTADRLMSAVQFQSLSEAEKTEALMRYTIVPEAEEVLWETKTVAWEPQWKSWDIPDTVQISKTENGWLLDVLEKCSLTGELAEAVQDTILELSFQVKNQTESPVVIDINQIRNKLSGASAAYPNENTCFHYIFRAREEDGMNRFQITLSQGKYEITDISWNCLPEQVLTEQQVTAAEETEDSAEVKRWDALLSGKQLVLDCRVEGKQDGYFVTSIPEQKGMELRVDGEKVPIQTVNEAFAGAELDAGKHRIQMYFSPPGWRAGQVLALISWGIWMLYLWRCRRKGRRRQEVEH